MHNWMPHLVRKVLQNVLLQKWRLTHSWAKSLYLLPHYLSIRSDSRINASSLTALIVLKTNLAGIPKISCLFLFRFRNNSYLCPRLYFWSGSYMQKRMGGDLIYRKALSYALSFDSWNLAVPKLFVKNKATGDAHLMCNTLQGICISRGLRRCSSLTSWAMPEPLGVGRVTDWLPRFFIY